MSIEHQLRQAAAGCSSHRQRYHDGERADAAKARMPAEVGMILGRPMELDLPPGAAEVGVLKPVEAHQSGPYGREASRGLDGGFVEAFGKAGVLWVFPE